MDNGINVVVAATAPKRAYRQAARARLACFAEVYVACLPELCRSRDLEGLWRRADEGKITRLPGAGPPYESPHCPDARVDASHLSAKEGARHIAAELARLDYLAANGIPTFGNEIQRESKPST